MREEESSVREMLNQLADAGIVLNLTEDRRLIARPVSQLSEQQREFLRAHRALTVFSLICPLLWNLPPDAQFRPWRLPISRRRR